MADTLKCSLKKCIQGNISPQLARVEVKTFVSPSEEMKHMEIGWSEEGEAMFHDICWKAVMHSLKMDNPFTLGPKEKEMVLEARKTAEYFDSEVKIKSEALKIANMIKSAQYAICFTGAGISTSAGIGDFRGKSGKWTERDREKVHGKIPARKSVTSQFQYENLRPTYTHEALCKLMEVGHLKHIISQNTDGLHRLSGCPRDKLSELHGNSFNEKCEKCSARYERPYAVRRGMYNKVPPKECPHCHFDHRTGRMCERKGCDGCLMNTIINFGDSLEKPVLDMAQEQAKKNDLVLCLGTTLRVTPACDLVEMGKEPVRLVICNRQPTPFDHYCYKVVNQEEGPVGSRIYTDCDGLLSEVMKCILSQEDLQEWEEGRAHRMEEYSSRRQSSDS